MYQKYLKGKAFLTPLFQDLSVSTAKQSFLVPDTHALALLPGQEPVIVSPASTVHKLPALAAVLVIKVSWQVTSTVPRLLGQFAKPRLWIRVLDRKKYSKWSQNVCRIFYLSCRLFWKSSCLLSFIDLFQVTTC